MWSFQASCSLRRIFCVSRLPDYIYVQTGICYGRKKGEDFLKICLKNVYFSLCFHNFTAVCPSVFTLSALTNPRLSVLHLLLSKTSPINTNLTSAQTSESFSCLKSKILVQISWIRQFLLPPDRERVWHGQQWMFKRSKGFDSGSVRSRNLHCPLCSGFF